MRRFITPLYTRLYSLFEKPRRHEGKLSPNARQSDQRTCSIRGRAANGIERRREGELWARKSRLSAAGRRHSGVIYGDQCSPARITCIR